METRLDKYLEDHCQEQDPALSWLERQTNIRTNYPRMLTGRVQGEFLYMLTRMIRPDNVLEIGTFTGYSTICIARGLSERGHIDTLELNDELEDLIIEGFERANVQDRISLHIGDAMEFLKRHRKDKSYDLVFIDANKREYPDYYELVLEMTHSGSFILADDVLWDGKVYEKHVPADKQTAGIVKFNDMVTADTRVENVILPVRHGLSIIRRK